MLCKYAEFLFQLIHSINVQMQSICTRMLTTEIQDHSFNVLHPPQSVCSCAHSTTDSSVYVYCVCNFCVCMCVCECVCVRVCVRVCVCVCVHLFFLSYVYRYGPLKHLWSRRCESKHSYLGDVLTTPFAYILHFRMLVHTQRYRVTPFYSVKVYPIFISAVVFSTDKGRNKWDGTIAVTAIFL